MAVSPKAQGKSIGWKLGRCAIDAAKAMGASRLYLEGNTRLKPSIRLYQKLGFEKKSTRKSAYARCNIQMELNLNRS